jgi:MYXO-CTERM domain-containing protein
MLHRLLPRAVKLLIAAAVLLGLTQDALAQKAIILHATRSSESTWTEYLKKTIADTGFFPDGVTNIDIAFTAPTLMQLLPAKMVVVISSDYGLGDGTGTGNVLGDYMAMAPGASVLMFLPYTWQTGLAAAPPVGGRFAMNYSLTSQVGTSTNTSTRVGMLVTGDPLVAGVSQFSCGSNCRRLTGLMPRPGATVAAYWNDGNILAVRGNNRADLNMFPADEGTISGSFAAEGKQLIINAITSMLPLAPSPGSMTFPATPLGAATTPIVASFRNNTAAPLSITDLGVDGPDRGMFLFSTKTKPSAGMPLSLASGASLTATISYKPTSQGNHTATLYATATGVGRVAIALKGVSKGNIFVTGAPINFGGIPSGTSKGPVEISLTNLGAVPIKLDKPVISNTMQYTLDLPAGVITYPLTMAPGSTYRFKVTFNPGMAEGDFPAKVTVTSDDASSPLDLFIRGLAGPPKLSVPFASLLLPDVPVDSMSTPLQISLTNEGFSDLDIMSATSDSTDFVVTLPMVKKIPAKESISMDLVFAPKMAGLRTGKITIKSNEPPPMMGTSDKIIDVAGTAVTPKFRASVSELDFGTMNIGAAAVRRTVTVFNEGDGALNVTGADILASPTSTSFKVITPGAIPYRIPAGTSADFYVDMDPKAAGMLSAVLRLTSSIMGAGGTAQVNLKGIANGAIAQLQGKGLDFGSRKVKTSDTRAIVIKNIGNQDLTLISAKLTQPAMSMNSFTLKPVAGLKVPGGGEGKVEVIFSPTVMGALTAKVDIDTDDPAVAGGTKFSVDVTGVGVTGNVSLDPTNLDFSPAIYVGQRSGMKAITVKNIGDVQIDEIVVRISGPDAGQFQRVGTFASTLKVGEETKINFIFAPSLAKAQHSATVVIEADKVAVPMMVSLKGSSISPVLSARPDSIKFDNTQVGQTSMPKVVILSNDGPQKLDLDIPVLNSQDFTIDTSETELTLAPDSTTKLSIKFNPQSQGSKSELIDIKLKASDVVAATIAVEGEATKKMEEEPKSGCQVSSHGGAAGLPGVMLLLSMAALIRRRRRR